MATIGSLNILLGMSTAAFTSGVKQAQSGIGSLISSVTSLGGVFGGLTASLNVGSLAGTFKSFVSDAMENIDAQAKFADSLSLTTEAFATFAYGAKLAGVDQETLAGSFSRMIQNADKLNVVGLTTEQAFMKVADAVAAATTPTERMNIAAEAFGAKAAAKMLPMLMQGSAGFAAMRAEAEKAGIALSRLDAARVEQANDAITKMGEVVTGVANTVAVQLSPFIQAAADKFVEFATSGQGAAGFVVDAIEWVVTAVAKAADYLALFQVGWYGLKTAAGAVLLALTSTLDQFGRAIVDVLNLIPGVEIQFTDSISHMADALAEGMKEDAAKASEAWDTFMKGENTAKATKFFADVRAQAAKTAESVADMNAKNAQQTIQAPAKVVDNTAGGVGDMVDLAMKGAEDIRRSAAQTFEATRTPLEKYESRIAELSGMLQAGAIDQETFGRAAQQAADALEVGAGPAAPQFASLDSSGGIALAAAESATLRVQSSQQENQKEANKAAIKTAELMKELVANLKTGSGAA